MQEERFKQEYSAFKITTMSYLLTKPITFEQDLKEYSLHRQNY